MFELIPWRVRDRESFPITSPSEIQRGFEDLINRFFGHGQLLPDFGRTFTPAIDMTDADEALIVEADIPGIDSKDLDISLTGDVLTIKGEKKEEKEEKKKGMERVERRFGSFSRSFRLPCAVHEDKIEAKFENGVVTLKLPKAEAAKKKSINIDLK